MRSDVKLGLAIGGVLLAVMIVYVLVVPGNSKRADQASTQQPTGDNAVTLEPVTGDETAAIPAPPPEAPGAEFTPSPPPASEPPGESVAVADPAPANRNAKEIDWSKLLDDPPTLMMDTPVPAPRSEGGAAAETALPAAPAAPETPPVAPTTPVALPPAPVEPPRTDVADADIQGEATTLGSPDSITNGNDNNPGPTVKPVSAEPAIPARTHLVRAGETLSSISAVAYGSPNHYPAIIRANPGIDPARLKIGQTINLPALDLTVGEPQIASAKTAPAIDATKQYRVVPGDSLHKISFRLYGKSSLADRIYELNARTIGDDPAKLKVGQVLDLPQPPTQTASSR